MLVKKLFKDEQLTDHDLFKTYKNINKKMIQLVNFNKNSKYIAVTRMTWSSFFSIPNTIVAITGSSIPISKLQMHCSWNNVCRLKIPFKAEKNLVFFFIKKVLVLLHFLNLNRKILKIIEVIYRNFLPYCITIWNF